MAQLSVHGPFDEGHPDANVRADPVSPETRQPFRNRERRPRDLERVETAAQLEQHLRVEAGADLSGEAKVVPSEPAAEQPAQPDTAALRIGEAADDELGGRLALHLQPTLRAPVLVRRVTALGDDALPAFRAGALPGRVALERFDSP